MRRVERAEEARCRSRYEPEAEDEEDEERSGWRAGSGVEMGDGEGDGEEEGEWRGGGRRRMEVVIGEAGRTSAIKTRVEAERDSPFFSIPPPPT